MTEAKMLKYIDMAVERTLETLRRKGALKDMDDVVYGNISYALSDYYNSGQSVDKITKALDTAKFDEYFDIIPMYYGDGMKIDDIARVLGKDTSTIVRNKKRLCLLIYTLLI